MPNERRFDHDWNTARRHRGRNGLPRPHLADHLATRGYRVTLLSRHPPPADRRSHSTWDGRSLGNSVAELEGAAALVNLAGRTLDCIKAPDHCDEILRSRVGTVCQVDRGECEIILAADPARKGKARRFIELTRDGLEELRRELAERSVPCATGWWGYAVIQIEDPDGNELFFPFSA